MHIQPTPSGRFKVIVQHGGHKRTGTADSRAAAQILGGRLLEEMGRNPEASMPLGQLLARHVERAELGVTTRADYRSVVRRLTEAGHPLLDAPSGEVTTGRLVRLYDDLADDWTLSRLSRLHTIISAAYRDAMRMDIVDRNPARGAAPKPPEVPDFRIPTDDEIHALVGALAGEFRAAFLLSALTGMRRGELVGLRWSDVDFDQGSLAIQRAVVYTVATGVVVNNYTKTKHNRRISVDPLTLKMLRDFRLDRIEHCMAFGIAWHEDRWLFTADDGGPRRPDWITQKVTKTRTKLGLTDVRLKDLRHAMITQMLAAGEAPAVIAGRAGHNVTTMARRYWKFMPGMDAPAAERHAERLLGNG